MPKMPNDSLLAGVEYGDKATKKFFSLADVKAFKSWGFMITFQAN